MTSNTPHPVRSSPAPRARRGGHGLMMVACCIPMLIIAIALVVAGVVGVGFIVVAVACTAMMALMMGGMNHGTGEPGAVNHQRSHRTMLSGESGLGASPANKAQRPQQEPPTSDARRRP